MVSHRALGEVAVRSDGMRPYPDSATEVEKRTAVTYNVFIHQLKLIISSSGDSSCVFEGPKATHVRISVVANIVQH